MKTSQVKETIVQTDSIPSILRWLVHLWTHLSNACIRRQELFVRLNLWAVFITHMLHTFAHSKLEIVTSSHSFNCYFECIKVCATSFCLNLLLIQMNCDNVGEFTWIARAKCISRTSCSNFNSFNCSNFFLPNMCPILIQKILYDNHWIASTPLSYIKT